MPNKTFSDFEQVSTDNLDLNIDDYLVGYRPSASTITGTQTPAFEIKVTTRDLVANIDAFADPSSINAAKIGFIPSGNNILTTTVNNKLNQLKTASDYGTADAAGSASRYQRLFVPSGSIINLLVPTDYPDIPSALNAIQNWHIENGAVVKIKIVTDITINEGINLNHPFGQNIQIVGEKTNGVAATLAVSSGVTLSQINFNVFTCSYGNKFGLIDNLIIEGKTITGNTWGSYVYAAIRAEYGALINLGARMTIKNWYYGVLANYGSVIQARGVIVSNCGEAGFMATNGSQIYAGSSSSKYNSVGDKELGHGYKAEYGSQITCEDSVATNNKKSGFASHSNSQVRASGCSASSNESGFSARDHGQIEAYNTGLQTSSSSNSNYGYERLNGGIIYGNLNGTGNGKGLLNKYAVAAQTGVFPNDFASLMSNDELLRLYTKDASPQVELRNVDRKSVV